jgi:hypothetical protein
MLSDFPRQHNESSKNLRKGIYRLTVIVSYCEDVSVYVSRISLILEVELFTQVTDMYPQ